MIKSIIPYVSVLIVGIVIGSLCRHPHTIEREVVQKDTIVVKDTVVLEKPVPYKVTKTEAVLVPVSDTVRVHDTLYVSLPFEKKFYKGEDYYAEVSGYSPRLDYLQVYQKEVTITKTEIETIRLRNQLSLGAELGYIGRPYIPIYLEYSYLLHKNVQIYGRLLYDLPENSYGLGAGVRLQVGW